MKTWYRLRVVQPCGRCGEQQPVGAPIFELSGIGWKVLRCHRCASQQGEAMPEHIAEAPTSGHVVRANFTERIASVRGLARDFKHAQGNDR